MQAGLTTKPLTFRQIFMAVLFWTWIIIGQKAHWAAVSNSG